ncbi:hypothetical protein RHMOL_Rhmol06G0108700 [Rhododendron molle]|uniref:Uncharacterized protein n=1 Tax=Rhododendron molle TaxID=49168 RepID=A0ACC0NCW1_RHOML|nr:hypothetical protein RHMOL_Rhmol06G0108700 [Rhododendron molle]
MDHFCLEDTQWYLQGLVYLLVKIWKPQGISFPAKGDTPIIEVLVPEEALDQEVEVPTDMGGTSQEW